MSLDDEAIVAGDSIEVRVDHGLQQLAWHAFVLGYYPLRRQCGAKRLYAERRLTRLAGQARIGLSGDEPLSFGQLVPLDFDADGDYGLLLAHVGGAEVPRLTLIRIQIPALHGAQAGDTRPGALPFGDDD